MLRALVTRKKTEQFGRFNEFTETNELLMAKKVNEKNKLLNKLKQI